MKKLSSSNWTLISSLSGFLGVAAGAFGAHLLKSTMPPEAFDNFKTGVLYQLIHSVVLLSVSISGKTRLLRANKFFLSGIILFSFSLYIYSITSLKMFAMITPIGGVSFLIGWIMLAYESRRRELGND